MAKTNLITGLDVGSGKLTCIAAAHDFETNTLKVLAGRSVPCRGIRRGDGVGYPRNLRRRYPYFKQY